MQTAEWYHSYFEVLGNMGWINKHIECAIYLSAPAPSIAEPCHRLNKVENAEKSGSVDRIVLELMTTVLTEPELALCKASIESLRGNDSALSLVDEQAHEHHEANFTVGVCRYVALLLFKPFNVRLKAIIAVMGIGMSSSRSATTATALPRTLPRFPSLA